MSRNTVTITDTSLSVEPHGLDKMWSYTSRLEFPLAHVRGATHDPGLRHEPKGWRGPGLQAGSKLSGTFHAEGTAQFWNISGYENTLVVTLEDERFTHLYLTVDDPRRPGRTDQRRHPPSPGVSPGLSRRLIQVAARHRTPQHRPLSRAFVEQGAASSPRPPTRGARYDHPGPAVGATRARTGCGVGPGGATHSNTHTKG